MQRACQINVACTNIVFNELISFLLKVEKNIQPLVPRMTNKIALVDEVPETGGKVKSLRESIKYFDKVFAVESKELKFFFDDDKEVHDNLMYCYFMQVSPHQQNLDLLNKNMLETINSNKPKDQKKTLEVCISLIAASFFQTGAMARLVD